MKPLTCFDLENTLVIRGSYGQVAHGALIDRVAEARHISRQTARRRFAALRKSLPSDVDTYAKMGLDYRLIAEVLDRVDPGPVEGTPQAAMILHRIKSLGARLAVITNAPCQWARSLLSHADIDVNLFDTIVTLCDVTLPKPNQEPFFLALRRCNTMPRNAVMIGDREDVDLLPARRIGMETILVSETQPLLIHLPDLIKIMKVR